MSLAASIWDGAERRAVAREHVADLALRDGHQSDLWMRYLNGKKKWMPPRRISGWKPASPCSAMKPDLIEPFGGPQLLDDADLVVGDVAEDVRHADENEEQR